MQLLIVGELGTIRVRSLICRNNYIVSGDDNLDSILRRRKEEKNQKSGPSMQQLRCILSSDFELNIRQKEEHCIFIPGASREHFD